jgi:hypothetical protein
MDIIDDTLFALGAYVKQEHNDQGLAYLEIFGVLQALSVQQDAVRKLYRIIKGNPIDLETEYPDIKRVRDCRVSVAGHPAGGNQASHFLVRYTVSKWGFELWKYDKTGARTAEQISLLELIAKQAAALNAAVGNLVAFMEAEDRSHKERFMGNSLEEIFKMSSYFSGKLFESISTRNEIGLVGVGCITEILSNFLRALTQRSSHFEKAGFVSYDIPRVEYAINKFEQYIKGDQTHNENDAYILASFIQMELDHLRAIAKEIDDDYRVNTEER